MKDPIILRAFTERTEAEIARGFLEAEGIEAAIAADDLGSEGPGMTFGKPIDLVVEAADVERARALLDQAVSASDLDAAELESEEPIA
jgi:hypothetical protein